MSETAYTYRCRRKHAIIRSIISMSRSHSWAESLMLVGLWRVQVEVGA